MRLIQLLFHFYISIQPETKWGYKELIYLIRAYPDITTFFPVPALNKYPFSSSGKTQSILRMGVEKKGEETVKIYSFLFHAHMNI